MEDLNSNKKATGRLPKAADGFGSFLRMPEAFRRGRSYYNRDATGTDVRIQL